MEEMMVGPYTKSEFESKLLHDPFYYGEAREHTISASDINDLLNREYQVNPDREWKAHFEVGKYFHVQTLEPEKLGNFTIMDRLRRNPGEEFLKQNEVTMCEGMKASHDAHIEARGLLYGPGVKYEVPAVTEIDGVMVRGKADCINPQVKWLVDLKSTSRIDYFTESIEKWYTAQLWIYWKLFGMPTAYIITDKKTLETRVMYPKQYLYADGKAKVLKAIEIYKNEYQVF